MVKHPGSTENNQADRLGGGFHEHEHTADWELEVWAPDLRALFEQAARGMYALSGIQLKPTPYIERSVQLSGPDAESLLVGFLQELLFLSETEVIGFDRFEILLDDRTLSARMHGAPIRSISKEIKAVTYHNLHIRKTERGLEARIVFDV
jgi:SHS2 domain-containing protein